MSYDGIAIREAMERLNNLSDGWYLPQVQRQYVWGSRHDSETYVCLLLDSLLRRFPIGGVVLWKTSKPVPHREFIRDYQPGKFAHQVDEGRWGAAKSLVYDGQQRLQTLYSVLYHTFLGRVLHFDLLFDAKKAEADDSGFVFRNADAPNEARFLRMTGLMHVPCSAEEKVRLERAHVKALAADNEATELVVRSNIEALWSVFVESNLKSIAFFAVNADTPEVVNEVFRRLNTGGMALNELDLVLSSIKAIQSDYEERLWELSEKIAKQSGGISFSSASILQFFYLLVKDTTSIKSSTVSAKDVSAFQEALQNDAEPLVELFEGYLSGLFNINHASIVPRWLAVLPIAAYLAARKRGGHEWRIKALKSEIADINRYFILSQCCDWNNQSMINPFSKLALKAGNKGEAFPLEAIRQVAVEKNRSDVLQYPQFLALRWFALKILTPGRTYIFHEDKPQLDHIFPKNLSGTADEYKEQVDVLWNIQPMPAGINNYKRARHPQEFFSSDDGNKYVKDYDFIPPADSRIWENHKLFLWYRRRRMRQALSLRYGLQLKTIQSAK